MQATWSVLRDEVEQRFCELSSDAELVERALAFLDAWLAKPLFAEQRGAVLGHMAQKQYALLLDSFYQLVPFGTGGRRGRVGYGPNRISQIIVAMSVQGHCNYLNQTLLPSAPRKVIIAFDTRVFSDIVKTYSFLGTTNTLLGLTSRDLAHIACEIYAGNGFKVHVAGLDREKQFLSTPELSFAIRHLGAIAGMNVSASHNHPDDNGFKFFNDQGAQDIPPVDQTMASYMGNVEEIKRIEFSAARSEGLISALPEDLHAAYIGTNLSLRSKTAAPVTVVYSPLCGTGNSTLGDVLRAAGHDVRLYAPHSDFDGTFSSIPFRLPNPEVPEAASPALALAREVNASLVFCTDPDADRLGLFAADSEGNWRYLNGNEIASVLAYYLVADRDLGPSRKGVLIKTMVTTRLLQKIAARPGCSIVPDLLVGFKYIAHVLHSLEKEGRFNDIKASPEDLILAGEESHGVLLTPKIRDKDAAGGALVICELVSQLLARNRHLPEYLDALSMECGNHQNVARSIVMRGIRGANLLADMMNSLREKPPANFDGLPVLEVRDYLSPQYGPLRSETEQLSRNLLLFGLEQARVVVRPSGTEPKAKVYVDVEGCKLAAPSDRRKAMRFAQRLARRVVEECIGRVGFRLSASANLLPDYVDLDLKAIFDTGFRNDLLAWAGRLGHLSSEEKLGWLRERLAPYGAGADPLSATSAALAHMLRELSNEVASPAIKEAFHDLEQTVADVSSPVEWIY